MRTSSTGPGVSGAYLGHLESKNTGVLGAVSRSLNNLENEEIITKDFDFQNEIEKLRKENEKLRKENLEYRRSISLPMPIPMSIPVSIPMNSRIGQIIGNAVPENEDEDITASTSNSIRKGKRKYVKSPPNNSSTVNLSNKKQIPDNEINSKISSYDPFGFQDSQNLEDLIENEGKKSKLNSMVPSLSPPSSSLISNTKNSKLPSNSPVSKPVISKLPSKSPNSKLPNYIDSKLSKKSPISSQITSPSKSPISSQNGIKANTKISPKKKNEYIVETLRDNQKEVVNKVEKRKKEVVQKVEEEDQWEDPDPEDDVPESVTRDLVWKVIFLLIYYFFLQQEKKYSLYFS